MMQHPQAAAPNTRSTRLLQALRWRQRAASASASAMASGPGPEPVPTGADTTDPALAARLAAPSPVRLLVVDDDLGTIQQLGRLLTGFAQLSFATNGHDGLALARSHRPDLIVLDAQMPGLSGFEVCKALKADPQTAHIPVLFATSHREVAVEAEALRLGAVDFLRKPLDPVPVLARLRLHLREPVPATPAHAGPVRLLIVDDDPAAIQLLRHVLQDLGECHFALDGEQALKLAPTLLPDLILLDLDLPGADGFAVCKQLKTHPTLRHVPVVFITQSNERGQESRALSLGADEFISKPFDAAVLRARVGRLVARKQSVDAALEAVRQQSRRVSDDRVAALVAAASDAIVAADTQGRIVLANAAACALSGNSEAELLGRPLTALLLATDGAALVDAATLRSGTGRLACRDGSAIDVDLAVSTVGQGADALQAVIVHDLRERERREAADRVLFEARASRSAMRSTLSFIAHEMGNPLNAISGFTQLMQASAGDTPLRVHARQLAQIAAASSQLQALMHDVIDLARMESGQLSVEKRPVELGALVTRACEPFAAQAALARVAIQLALPAAAVHALADSRRLAQCLGNLLSNALKYGQAAGQVAVELRVDGEHAVISVADQGRGMSAAQLAHLFEPYNRLGQESSGVPGSGLGLTLTRELVQAMGGRLEVESREGAGTRFSIWLARCAAEA